MRYLFIHASLTFLSFHYLPFAKCYVHIEHVDQEPNFVLKSINYPLQPGNDSIDNVWIFHTSLQLEINYFELDGQNGDFLMVSDGPFQWPPGKEPNETVPVQPTDDFFIEALMVSNGLILSWSVNQTINVHTESKDLGTFIYFHAESISAPRNKTFRGFDILVKDFDDIRMTPPPVTEEPVVTNPPDTDEIYFSTFLACMEPVEFLNAKNDFKKYIVIMANNYYNSTDPFTEAEVNIPDRDGVRYCDPKWSVYHKCVELRFTIVRFDENGQYIMTSKQLKRMWDQEALSVLKDNNVHEKYCPYTPPNAVSDINAWVWLAFVLGIILVFSSILCIIWIKKSSEDYNKQTFKKLKGSDEPTEPHHKRFDHDNPIYNFIKGLQLKSKEEEMNIHLGNYVDDGGPVIKRNELFQYEEYHNQGYEDDEVAMQMSPKFTGLPISNNSTSMNRFPKRNMNNMTTLEQADISDTEI